MFLYRVVIVPFLWVKLWILFVNPHRGLFFVVGRSQRCEAPARPVYVFQYMWHPRRAVRLCTIVLDPHPTGCMHPSVVGGVFAYHRRCVNSGGFDRLSHRISLTPAYNLRFTPYGRVHGHSTLCPYTIT